MADVKQSSDFNEVVERDLVQQAKFFLRRFANQFQGNFNEILDLIDEFKSFSGTPDADRVELDEIQAHRFLEKRGETLTVKEMRDYLKEIDVDNNNKVALIEYLVWKYKKTVIELLEPPPMDGAVPQHLLDALDAAIDDYLAQKKAQKDREERVAFLEAQKAKGGIAGADAQKELDAMKDLEIQQQIERMRRKRQQLNAQKAIDEAEKEDPYVLEQKRLAEEKARKEQEEKDAAAASRQRLKERAKLWS